MQSPESQVSSVKSYSISRSFALPKRSPNEFPEIESPSYPLIKALPTSESSTFEFPSQDEEEEEEAVPLPRAPLQPEPEPFSASTTEPLPSPRRFVPEPQTESIDLRKQLAAKEKETDELSQQLAQLSNSIQERDAVIEELSEERESMQKVVSDLRKQLSAKERENCELSRQLTVSSERQETLQLQLDELRIQYEECVHRKDEQIRQLQALVQSLSVNTSASECRECLRLRAKMEEVTKMKSSADSSAQEEVQRLRTRAAQLEVLIRSSEDQSRSSSAIDAELQFTKDKLIEREKQIEKMRMMCVAAANEVKEYQRKLEESDRKLRVMPEIEQRYRAIVEQLKGEYTTVVNDGKQKAVSLKTLGEKLSEAQRANRELQCQIQRAREEAAGAREEAAFHRAKSEEVTKRMTETSETTVKDANTAVQHLGQQLQEKIKENSLYRKMLSDTRRQLAILTETNVARRTS
jgi:chromosome segregation ATPase